MDKFCSIIMTHWSQNGERSEMLKASLRSLFTSTSYPFELIVIDNGGSDSDSKFLSGLCEQGKINTYIRNANNMSFGYARNQGLALAQGDYICISDNDLLYKKGWLEESVRLLEAFPEEKIYTTPIHYPTNIMRERYNVGELELDGVKYQKNMRAGSNCFIARRKDFETLGGFMTHRIAGSRWTDNAVREGYSALVIPGELVEDLGLRKGYNLGQWVPLRIKLSNGKEVFFNSDEGKDICNTEGFTQRRFNGTLQ